MNKKILFCATVDYHFKAFHMPYLKWFKEQGWDVHVAASGELDLPFVDEKFNISIQRSPFHLKNIVAYNELKQIIDKNNYEIIHCHTPMGGVLTRLAARHARQKGTKVIYTAHGFHFCKDAPIQNWMIYYPIEKLLARNTDCLITINGEDYNFAKHQLRATNIEHVYGVGVDTDRYKPVDIKERVGLRESFGYKPDDFLLFYAAEFNKNKNQQFLIKALSSIKEQVPNGRLLLAGEGPLKEECINLAKQFGVEKMVDFLGYRNDIDAILPICDLAVASSLREGLPVNIMEAMACALPVIATKNRGHSELIQNQRNGWTVNKKSYQDMGNKIKMLANNSVMRVNQGKYGREIIIKNYSITQVLRQKTYIYKELMKANDDLKRNAQ